MNLNFRQCYLKRIILVMCCTLNFLFLDSVSAQVISGTKSIGPTSADYTTIGAAFTDLITNGINGPVILELRADYLSTAEIFPLLIGTVPGANNTNTITLRPEIGAIGLEITSNQTQTISLYGATHLQIDGRPGGVGTISELTISNSSTTGRALLFTMDASNNTIRHCTIKGVTSNINSGVISFGTTNSTSNGNDSNIIEYCHITAGLTRPTYLIYSGGTTTNVNAYNSNNQIRYCHLTGFGGTLAEAGAIKFLGGNTEWTVTGNHIYQPDTITGTIQHVVYGINMNSSSNNTANNFTITNNYIGGSAPFCGGDPWVTSYNNGTVFRGIDVHTAAATPSIVSNNKINNIHWNTTSAQGGNYGAFTGIWHSGGAVNFTNNTIGSLSGADSIVMTSSGTGSYTYGIGISATGSDLNINVTDNIISGIKTQGTVATAAVNLCGIYFSGSFAATTTLNITNNRVGGNMIASNATTNAQSLFGIYGNATANSSGIFNISDNIIEGLENNHAGTTVGQTIGIRCAGGINTISYNTIRNISSASPQTGITLNAGMTGISITSTNNGNQLIHKNVIYGLHNTAVSAAVQVSGIYYASTSTSVDNVVSNNFIHSLQINSTNTSSNIIGIDILNGKANYQNNIIRLGIDQNGSSIETGYNIKGIQETGTSLSNFYFNSVYVGGNNVIPSSDTYAFFSSATPADMRNVHNNIFVNGRSDTSSGSSSNFAVNYSSLTNTNSNGNIYHTPGTSGKIGNVGGTSHTTFADWVRQNPLIDGASMYGSPNFINSTGDSSMVDLRVQSPTIAERNGVPVPSVLTDFDESDRDSLTPVDIGAKAGNFTGADVAAPAITFVDIPHTFSTADTVLIATITDGTGLHTTGTLRPRLYIKKTSGLLYASTPGTLISGTNKDGQWQFNIAGSLVGGFTTSDTLQYFIVAQDSAATPNVGSFPAGALATSVNLVLSAPLAVKSYRILLPIQGIRTVGAGGAYPNLTVAFADLALNGLSGPLTLSLLPTYSSSDEVFPIVAPEIVGNSRTNTITIRPQAGATGLSITSSESFTLDLNGAKHITIDGRVGGTGTADLTIENTSLTGIAVRYINDAVGNTLTYCKVKGVNNTTSSGIIYFGNTTGSIGNDSNIISYCEISSGTTPAAAGIYSAGANSTLESSNSDNLVTDNLFYDIWRTTTESAFIKCVATTGGNRWTITNNSFYQTQVWTSTGTHHHQSIMLMAGDGHVVTGNYIGGSQPLCGGTPWTLAVTTAARFTGINFRSDTIFGALIANNTITNFDWQSSSTVTPISGGTWAGILFTTAGVATIRDNTIGSITSNNAVIVKGRGASGHVLGIMSTPGNRGLITISNNKIGGFNLSTDLATRSLNFTGIYTGGTATNDVRGLVYNIDSNTIGGPLQSSIASTQSVTALQTVIGIQNSVNAPGGGIIRLSVDDVTPVQNHVYFRARYNTIQNLVNTHAGTTVGQTIGIRTTAGVNELLNNTIANLSNTSPQTGIGINVPVAGIIQSGAAAAFQNISGNHIYNLFSDTAATQALNVTGIAYAGIASGSNKISGNFIHHLSARSTNNTSTISGIHAITGNTTFFNNMISLGSDTSGASLSDYVYNGIMEDVGTNNFIHNSIHIGHILDSTNSNSYCINSNSFTTSARSIMNNILSNQHSGIGGTGVHTCIAIQNKANLTLNRNIYSIGTTSGNVLGRLGGTDYINLSAWQTATALDKHSAEYPSNFIMPDGSSELVNLHIQGTTPAEGGGIFIPEITHDIDGHLRDTLSPVDIGADAGNFTPVDMFPPSLHHENVGNTSDTTNRIIVAQIHDATGVSVVGLVPHMYYRTNTTTTFASVAGTLASGTVQNGTWEFVMDETNIPGGINRGDSVYYFFLVQDSSSSNNLTSVPEGADAPDVTSLLTPPSTMFSYVILSPMSGSYNVGVGHPLTNLTDSNGAFAYMQVNGIEGDVELKITSDLTETGIFEFPVTPYKIKVVPDSDTVRNITGNVLTPGALIRLRGVRNVVIDGSYNGAGRYLRFANTNPNRPTLAFLNDATRDTITHCIIEGANGSSYTIGSGQMVGVIAFNAATSTGNDSNCISYCYIATLPTSTNVGFLLTSTGPNTVGLENSENSIIHNEFVNAPTYAIQLATGTGDNWNISYNSFYRTAPTTWLQYVMQIYNGDAFTISHNNFGGSAPDRSGAPFQTSSSMYFINFTNTASLNKTSTISYNKMSNILVTGANATCQAFQLSGGKIDVIGNTIGGGEQPSDVIMTGGNTTLDIVSATGTVANEINIMDNTIGNITYTGTNSLRLAAININAGTSRGVISNNTIRDISNNGQSSTDYTVGISVSSTGLGYTISNNLIHNLQSTNMVAATLVSGINVLAGTNNTVSRNRIYNLGAVGNGITMASPRVYGIRVAGTGNTTVANNQISLGHNAINETRVYGLFDAATSGNNNYYYNSVFIGGSMDGDNNSYAFYRENVSNIDVKNNILYNKRTVSGLGKAYAKAIANPSGITENSFGYNLAIVNDTTAISEMPLAVNNGWGDLSGLYTTTNNTNWTELTSNVTADSLFVDTAIGDLNINTNSTASWYANGKGVRIEGVTGDFTTESGVRSESFATGATDIGSHEFTTTTVPPSAVLDASTFIGMGTTTPYIFGGREVATITWGTTGSLPISVDVKYYSGVNPSNVTAGQTHLNAYWDVTANAGSGYSYSISLLQDSAIMGNVSSFDNIQVARYNNATSFWNAYPAVSNPAAGNFMATGFVSTMGMFTGTDGENNPLPVKMISFDAKAQNKDVLVSWVTLYEKNTRAFVVERSTDNENWNEAGKLTAKGNTASTTSYQLTDANALAYAGKLYYRLRSIDFDGSYVYSNTVIASQKQDLAKHVSASPNPFAGDINVEIESDNDGTAQIQITDITGKHIGTQVSKVIVKGTNNVQLHTANLDAGIYFLTVKANGQSQTIKVVKQ